MSLIEDEVRQALSVRSQRVAPAAELPTGVAARVDTMQRKRRSSRIVAAGAMLAGLAICLPLLSAASDDDQSAYASHAPAAHAHTHAKHSPRSASPNAGSNAGVSAAAPASAPANVLNWQQRGAHPDAAVVSFLLASLPHEHVAPLWAGRVDGVGQVAVVQYWASNAAKASIGAVVADSDGDSPRWVAQGTLYFSHGTADPNGASLPARLGIAQMHVVTVDLGGGRVLALGAPDISSIWYAPDGVRFTARPTSDGVAVITRAPQVVNGTDIDLVQARTAAGVIMTPADAVAVRDANLLNRATPSSGWALPDIA